MSYRGEQTINGKIYVYDAVAIWDPVKQRSKQKRTYIGTRDIETGEFIPNKKYYELYKEKPPENKHAVSAIKSVEFGNIYLFNQIASAIHIDEILESVFPDCWQEILACAWYTISEQNALYLCGQWSENTVLPEGMKLSSQRISELLKRIDENSRMVFYKQWATKRMEKEYLALDISSISSYSELIQFVELGYNRDEEKLPQVNLAMLIGENSRLPVFCRLYPGSIKDVTTLAGMVRFIDELKLSRMHYVMDRGFYSENGIKKLLEKRIKFIVGIPFTTSIAKDIVREAMDDITNPANAIEVNGQLYYAKTKIMKLHNRRCYLHVYFDDERHTSERTIFMQKLLKIEELLKNSKVARDDKLVKKYFFVRSSKTGLKVRRNEEAIQRKVELNGFFTLLSYGNKKADYCLDVYKTKDVVEKSFDNLKNDLDLKRLNIHSDVAMQGRIFIGFIGLIFIAYIRKIMKEKNLYKNYTFHSLICELKKLKRVHLSNGIMLTELSKKQKEIYKVFGIKLPNSSSI